MILRQLTLNDLPEIAAVHQVAFPSTVASRLGREASRRQYESFMNGPYVTAGLGAFEEDRLMGFCFVGVRYVAESHFLRQHAHFLLWRLVSRPWLMADPVICRRLGLAIRLFFTPRTRVNMPNGSPKGAPSMIVPPYGIQLLAVDPVYRGIGVGRNLVEAGENHAYQQGFSEIQLSVDPDNVPAIGLYLRMGWQKSSPSGEWLGLMSKRLVPG